MSKISYEDARKLVDEKLLTEEGLQLFVANGTVRAPKTEMPKVIMPDEKGNEFSITLVYSGVGKLKKGTRVKHTKQMIAMHKEVGKVFAIYDNTKTEGVDNG